MVGADQQIKGLTRKSMFILHFQKNKLPIKYIMKLEPWLLTLQKNQKIQSLHLSLASLSSKVFSFSQTVTTWKANHVASSSDGNHHHVELFLLLTFLPNVVPPQQARLVFFLVLSFRTINTLQNQTPTQKNTLPTKRAYLSFT